MKEEEEANYNLKRNIKEKPNSNYHDKYKHIIGDEVGKSAAQQIETNASFGIGNIGFKQLLNFI